jgi:hypothetical protein
MIDVRDPTPAANRGAGESSTVTEFQKRRRRTWRMVRIWIVVGIVGAIGFCIPFWTNPGTRCRDGGECTLSLEDTAAWENVLMALSFVALATALIAGTKAVYRYYRCPKCDAVPMRSSFWAGAGGFEWERGVDPSPSVCPKCGAKLS